MIRHIVFFSAREPAAVDTIVTTLRGYRAIPGVERLEVARNCKRDTWSNEIDVVVHVELASWEALAAYKAHPIYQAGIEVVRPLRALRYAVDYDATAADPPDAATVPKLKRGEADG